MDKCNYLQYSLNLNGCWAKYKYWSWIDLFLKNTIQYLLKWELVKTIIRIFLIENTYQNAISLQNTLKAIYHMPDFMGIQHTFHYGTTFKKRKTRNTTTRHEHFTFRFIEAINRKQTRITMNAKHYNYLKSQPTPGLLYDDLLPDILSYTSTQALPMEKANMCLIGFHYFKLYFRLTTVSHATRKK